MKSVNIYFLSQAEDTVVFSNYEKVLSNRTLKNDFRYHEIASLNSLVNVAVQYGASIEDFDSFYFGYSIPQIGKEFDLIKITNDSLLNIELKSAEIDLEKIQKQLIRNKYYLQYTEKDLYLYTYIASTNDILKLNGDSEIEFCDASELVSVMRSLTGIHEINIDSIFRVSNYLVSPLNTPSRFLKDQYFLTNQQEEFKNAILSFINNKTYSHYEITGAAGTGKTLLLYDVVKACAKIGGCCVVHCGNLSEGHVVLGNAIENVNIISAKRAQLLFDFSPYQFIFIDEAHRLRDRAYEAIVNASINHNIICIWSLDSNQTLSNSEQERDISAKIEKLDRIKSFHLTKKIRTNQELANFIYRLLDQNEPRKFTNYSDVQVIFAKNPKQAKQMLLYFRAHQYVFVNYTPSQYFLSPLDQYDNSISVHSVIGQEFDKVIMILDSTFDYDESGKLRARIHPNPDYLYRNMLFQGLTRVREKLCLLIVENDNLFQRILSIL